MPLKERSGNLLREFININHELVNNQPCYFISRHPNSQVQILDRNTIMMGRTEDLYSCIDCHLYVRKS